MCQIWCPYLSRLTNLLAHDTRFWSRKCLFLGTYPPRLSEATCFQLTRSAVFFSPPQGCINSPALWQNLGKRNLDHLTHPQNITLVHYSVVINQIKSSKQELVITLNPLVKDIIIRRWEINSIKTQWPSTSMKFIGIQWYWIPMKFIGIQWRDIPSKGKNKLLHLATPISTKEVQYLLGLFGFRRSTFFIWECYSGIYTKCLGKLLVLCRSWCWRILKSSKLLPHLDDKI